MDGSIQSEEHIVEQSADMTDMTSHKRVLEAMLFAATEPVAQQSLVDRMPEDVDVDALLSELSAEYADRGVNLTRVAGRWAFRTAPDLAGKLQIEMTVSRRLSRAAVETLAIIAYHQPVTRGEIEEIRGVALSKGTLDLLLEIGWIKPVGRRRTPGRPVTWGTSNEFLNHFNLDNVTDLPGVDELKAAGLLDKRPARTIFGEVAAHMDELPENPIENDGENTDEPLDPDDGEKSPQA